MSMNFKRAVEDFSCEKCNFFVVGDGYTNHCPKCLWSKHVDKNPGDRIEKCGGLMEPIDVILEKGDEYSLVHRCVLCGYKKKNKISKKDDFDLVLSISKKKADAFSKKLR